MGGIKYNTGTTSNTIKLGNFVVANDKVKYGSTDDTGFWTTVDVPIGGYVIYGNKATQGPSIYAPENDVELIRIASAMSGQNFTTASECFTWFSTQSDIIIKNKETPRTVTSGLVFYLDAGFLNSYPRTGSVWSDISGVGNNGNLINGPTFNSTDGGGIAFDGIDDYGQMFSKFFQGVNDFTFSCLFKNTNSSYTYYGGPLYSEHTNGAGTDNTVGFWIGEPDSSTSESPFRLAFWYQVSNSLQKTYSSSTIPVNQITIATFVREGNQAKIYINGILDVSATRATGALDTKGNNPLFASVGYGARFKGNIYSMMVYNRALSSTEVLQNYQATYTRFFGDQVVTDGLVLHLDAGYTQSYPGTGSVWKDISGNANHVTLYNGVSYQDGALVSDGVNDYGRTTNTLNLSGLSAITIIVVCRTPTTSFGMVYEHTNNWNSRSNYNGVTYGGFGLAINSTGGGSVANKCHFQLIGNVGGSVANADSPDTTNFQHYVTSHDFSKSSDETVVYVNGTFSASSGIYGSNNTQTFVNDYLYLWSRGGGLFYQLSISQLLIYNRSLTNAEILQNYNATKSRYGL